MKKQNRDDDCPTSPSGSIAETGSNALSNLFLPPELIHLIAHCFEESRDYLHLALVNKRLHNILLAPLVDPFSKQSQFILSPFIKEIILLNVFGFGDIRSSIRATFEERLPCGPHGIKQVFHFNHDAFLDILPIPDDFNITTISEFNDIQKLKSILHKGTLIRQSFWHLGALHGDEEAWDMTGMKKSLVTHKFGKREGEEIRWVKSHVAVRCTWLGGVLHGTKEMFRGGERRSVQHFENGVQSGLAEVWFQSGLLKSRVLWQSGARQGLEESFDRLGNKTAVRHWSNGRRDGLEEIWHRERLLYSQEWKNGVRNGAEVDCHDENKKIVTLYVDGKKTGRLY